MNENKGKNKILIAIIILLLLSNVCFIGFIIYDKVNNKDGNEQKDEVKEDQNNDEQKDDEEEQKTNLEVSETEAKKTYYDIIHDGEEKIITDGFSFLESYYNDKKVVYTQDIKFGDIIGDLHYKLPDEKVEHSFKDLSNNKYQDFNKFLISDIKEIYKFYFGEKEEWTNFESGYPLGVCNINGDYYECKFEHEGFGFEDDGISFLSAFDKYETDSENLYVYEKAVYYYGDSLKGDFYTSYDDYELKNELVELEQKAPEILLEPQYRDKFLTYKHTFKQNSDGTFYLYSTEPVIK